MIRNSRAALVDTGDTPGVNGEREGFKLADVYQFDGGGVVAAAQRRRCCHEPGQAADVAGLVAWLLQGRLVSIAIDRGPPRPGACGQVVAGGAGQRGREAMRGD